MQHDKLQSVIIRTTNWLGDCVMLYPALDAFSRSGFKLHLVGPKWIKAIYERSDWHYDVIARGIFQHSRQLKAYSEQSMVVFPNSFSSALAAALASKKIVGYRADGRGLLLSKAIKKQVGLHEVVYFWNLAKAAAGYFDNTAVFAETHLADFRLPVLNDALAQAQHLHKEHGVAERYWVFCPSAVGKGGAGASKIWPYWNRLAQYFKEQNMCCVICPGPGDAGLALPGVITLGGINLSVYKALLAKAVGVIANDTGPMHLAAAVGVPTLGIYGVSDPARTRPWQGHFLGGKDGWPSLDLVLSFIKQMAG